MSTVRRWGHVIDGNFRPNNVIAEPLEPRLMLAAAFRPPAVPLITSDPYLSVWSESNNLNGSNTVSWTGETQALVSLIRVDGVTYRLMGDDPSTLAAFPQTSVQVLPTRSIYTFSNGHVAVTMTFMQPALPTDLSAYSLPLSYITWDVHSVDGLTHSVQIYDSTSSELAVNATSQLVTWQRGVAGGLTTLDIGTTTQDYFDPSGDQVNIDWGYAYAAAPAAQSSSSIGYDTTEITTFETTGALTNTDDPDVPRAVTNRQPVMAFAFNFGTVGAATVERYVIVAYNEVYSVDYFGEDLTPYWARNGTTVAQMLTQAENNYGLYTAECTSFDNTLMADMTAQGGADYAQIGALAYRQTFAATGLAADPNGQPMMFTKENTSNGDIATVDVIFPMFPQLLLFSPTLAKAALQPVMEYAESTLWANAYAPHDLGTYPDAIGDGTGNDDNEQMPVEETANMLIMLDAIAQDEHSTEYADQFWSLISSWATYLQPYANSPGEQLTTNDFLGTLDNSTNLAVKAIEGLGAFANLCQMRGDTTDAAAYTSLAQADVQHWMSESISSNGTDWLFEYGDQGTGVQLYNLAMDKILGFNLFPASVAALDISYSESVLQTYGVPISSTTTRTSIEWSLWNASMATNSSDFQTLITPIYNYLNTTTDRVPMTDIYTDSENTNSFAYARPVVGGVFIEMLTNPSMWSYWSSQDQQTLGTYAAFPSTSGSSVSTPSPRRPTSPRRTATAATSNPSAASGSTVGGFAFGGFNAGNSILDSASNASDVLDSGGAKSRRRSVTG